MVKLRLVVVRIFSACVMVPGANMVFAQDYPNKPVRIMTSEVGGGTDRMVRLIAPKLSGPLGQPVIIENRPSTTVGAIAAKLPPDGYSVITAGTTIVLAPLWGPQDYDPVRDFAPITLALRSPLLLIVHPSVPIKSVKELIALAKARPGDLNYATTGTGSAGHLAGELLKSMTRVNIVRINYKGTAGALNDLIAGEVQLSFNPPGAVVPHIKSGRLRSVAVTSLEPSQLFPGVPTVAASLPGFEMSSRTGILAPAKTPAAIINRLNQEFVRVLHQADIKEQALANGVEAGGSTPEEYGAMMKSDIAMISKLIKVAGLRAEGSR